MRDFAIPSKIFITKVENHQEIKQEILDNIKSNGTFGIETPTQRIHHSDWFLPPGVERKYLKTVLPVMENHMLQIRDLLGFKTQRIINFWCQQYKTGDHHGWHVHPKCMWSNVYFVELPSTQASTTFQFMGTEFQFPINEGEILAFPGFYSHCSKPNMTDETKTVIAFNCDYDYE